MKVLELPDGDKTVITGNVVIVREEVTEEILPGHSEWSVRARALRLDDYSRNYAFQLYRPEGNTVSLRNLGTCGERVCRNLCWFLDAYITDHLARRSLSVEVQALSHITGSGGRRMAGKSSCPSHNTRNDASRRTCASISRTGEQAGLLNAGA